METSTNNLLANNVIKGGSVGITVESSTTNSVVNNTVTESSNAILLNSASDNYLRDNKLRNNFLNFGVRGSGLSVFDNDVDTSNTIDGKPIYYWIDKSNEVVPSDAAYIILVNCTGMTIHDFELSLSIHGIVLANTNSSSMKGNKLVDINFSSEYYGMEALDILLFSSFDNIVENNRANIYLDSSSNNRIAHNTGIIRLNGSDSNEITENHMTKISFVSGDWSGIILSSSSNNQIIGNIMSGNQKGILIRKTCNNNLVVENYINDNNQGGIINSANHTIILGNKIIDNGNYGIAESGHSTVIIGNKITSSYSCGLLMGNSNNSSIIGNEIDRFDLGGSIGINTTNCRFIGNNITKSMDWRLIWLLSINPATFYHNNFFCEIDIRAEVNHIWDNGKEGNYWINYNGTDNNGDGIGDTPYEISNNNFDNYPLMTPFDISTIPIELPEWMPPNPSP
jgi:parallel beta-helix repeat protein